MYNEEQWGEQGEEQAEAPMTEVSVRRRYKTATVCSSFRYAHSIELNNIWIYDKSTLRRRRGTFPTFQTSSAQAKR